MPIGRTLEDLDGARWSLRRPIFKCRPVSRDSELERSESEMEHHTWSYSNFLEMRDRLEQVVAAIA
jgi:hypothetical protein